MPKKKTTPTPSPTPTKKLEVLALKRKTPKPEPGVESINEAPSTPVELPEPPVALEPFSTHRGEVEFLDPPPLAEPITLEIESAPPVGSTTEATPGAEVKSDAQPLTELLTPTHEAEVKPDTPTPSTPELLEAPPDGAIFQAVGVIVGEVTFSEGKATVAIGEKTFPLFYAPQKKKVYYALEQELKSSGSLQRLKVYPRVIHFPKPDDPHQIAFQLVNFFRKSRDAKPTEITSKVGDFEFKLSGLWQFIPICATPCVSIFKNFSQERLEFIKAAKVAVKVKFMQGTHVPVFWPDAPVRPFRFNPNLTKEEQGQALFVQVKAIFAPDKGVFLVQALTATPAAKPPRYLKVGKADRLQVAQDKLKTSRGVKKDKVEPQVVKKVELEATPKTKPTNDSQPKIG